VPKEARWRFEETVRKARPLCDALVILEEAIYETIDDASWLISEGVISDLQFVPLMDFYREDAIEAARERWGNNIGAFEPEDVPMLVKYVVDLLTKKKQ
jgi:hypothetical protein